jgi:hypothetical protein
MPFGAQSRSRAVEHVQRVEVTLVVLVRLDDHQVAEALTVEICGPRPINM